jgi:peptidoglycan/xylan/chitin deacetylase (PgdA/CDA1 family)
VKALSILYHDVVETGAYDHSGFRGPSANSYKLEHGDFAEHLESIASVLHNRPATVFDLLKAPGGKLRFLLTFDDGGSSACRIAEMLEQRGWLAHFFVTTDYIGTSGFLTPQEIRSLHSHGHVIGSHSCSHPRRMSTCSSQALETEWKLSTEVLSQLLGVRVTVASVPGGDYSHSVAAAAAKVGMQALFTSEPTSRCHRVGNCWILGRYGVAQGTSASLAADLAAGSFLPCLEQRLFWNVKKVLKRVAGSTYDRVRAISFGEDRS